MTTKETDTKHGELVAKHEDDFGMVLRLWSDGAVTGPKVDSWGRSSQGENEDFWHETFYDLAVRAEREGDNQEAGAIARALMLPAAGWGEWEQGCAADIVRMAQLGGAS